MMLPSEVPHYGSLTNAQEYALYRGYRYLWLRYVEHELRRQLNEASDDFVNANWPLMSHDQKAAVWALMDAGERERIRRIRNVATD